MVNPILAEVVRGTTVESFHRGSACVVDSGGKVLARWGDADAPTCPRSAVKLFQALPLLDSGAADAFHVSDEEVALACASHSGETEHVVRVEAWLTRMGLSEADLECGAHAPVSVQASEALIRAGRAPTALCNNCSGKHAGFLALAKHIGAPTRGYIKTEHPVQQAALKAIGDMTDQPTARFSVVCDGCSAPNVFIPLTALARGFAKLGARSTPAMARIIAAVKAHPVLMSGHGRPCAQLIPFLAGMGIVKTGAEGVYAAALPEQGLGVAVKIDDGAPRASIVAITALLEHLRAFKPGSEAVIAPLKEPRITAWAGIQTGVVRPAKGWLN